MRNRHKKSYICIAFALVSALSALAQSGRTDSPAVGRPSTEGK